MKKCQLNNEEMSGNCIFAPRLTKRNAKKMIFQKFMSYLLFFRKNKTNGQKPNFNLRAMHFINKISILMFILGILFLIAKLIRN